MTDALTGEDLGNTGKRKVRKVSINNNAIYPERGDGQSAVECATRTSV